jgi:hypothetical protein
VGVAGQTAGSDMDVLCAGAIVVAWDIREIEFFPDTVDRDSGAVRALLADGVAGPRGMRISVLVARHSIQVRRRTWLRTPQRLHMTYTRCSRGIGTVPIMRGLRGRRRCAGRVPVAVACAARLLQNGAAEVTGGGGGIVAGATANDGAAHADTLDEAIDRDGDKLGKCIERA